MLSKLTLHCATLLSAALLSTASLSGGAAAANFPAGKPITILVGYAAGGGVDGAARLLAQGLEKELNTSVQVVNKAGAASQVAMTFLTQAKPDGYTVALAVLPTIATHYLDPDRDPPYAQKSFQTVGLLFKSPGMIAVPVESKYKSLKELVEAARKAPSTVSISDSGIMGTPHMTVLGLELAAGVKFNSVHYDGGAPSVTALMGNYVDAVAGGIGDGRPNYLAGKFRILGVADDKDNQLLPGAPTFRQQGYDVVIGSSTGIIAPAGTPRDVVDVISAGIKKYVDSKEGSEWLLAIGQLPFYMDPDTYKAHWLLQETWIGPMLKSASKKDGGNK